MSWYYSKGGAQQGPIAWEQLVSAARSGTVGATDLVWTEGMPGWQPAGSIQGMYAPGFVPPSSVYEDDPTMRMILPIGRSGWAIASGYLGLVSILIIPAPFAIITGIIAIFDIRKNEAKHGMGRAIFGIVMGAVFSALFLYGFIASQAGPQY